MIRKDKAKDHGGPQHPPHHVCVCPRCSANSVAYDEMLAHRVDYWKTAQSMLGAHDWPEGSEPTSSDVLELALFLAEEN